MSEAVHTPPLRCALGSGRARLQPLGQDLGRVVRANVQQPSWARPVVRGSGRQGSSRSWLGTSPGHGGCGDQAALLAVVWRISNWCGAWIPRLVCRRRGLYQASIHSKIAEASSSWVAHRRVSRSSRCRVDQNDSIIVLSTDEATRPSDPSLLPSSISHGEPGRAGRPR